MKIKYLIFIACCCIGLVPLAITIGTNLPGVIHQFHAAAEERRLARMQSDVQTLQQFFERRRENIRITALLPGIADLIGNGSSGDMPRETIRKRLNGMLMRWYGSQQDVTGIYLLDKSGRVQFSITRDPASGVLSPDSENEPENWPARKIFTNGMQTVNSKMFFSETDIRIADSPQGHSHQLFYLLGTPLYQGQAEPTGMLVFSLNLTPFLLETNSDYLVQGDGAILHSPAHLFPDIFLHDHNLPKIHADFPGIQQIFAAMAPAILTGKNGNSIAWLPIIASSVPQQDIWAGLQVDISPVEVWLADFKTRITIVIVALILAVFIFSMLVAYGLDRKKEEVMNTLHNLLGKGEHLPLTWTRPAELRNFSDELNQLIKGYCESNKAREQAEERLLHAQKLEAMATLAAGIAHDFNNILTPIMISAEIAKYEIPPESPAQKYMDRIIQAARRSAGLVKQILSFSRQQEQAAIPVQLQFIAKEVLKLLSSALPPTIKIVHRIDESCGPVEADPTQLHQVLMNLCVNSFHAMEKTGGILEVTLNEVTLSETDLADHSHCAPGTFLRLSVSDTGCGIEETIREKIFEPYFTTKALGKGTGVGLSLVKGIVSNLGGYLTIYSEVGKGSTFNVYLPVTAEGRKIAAIPVNPPAGGTERILLIDDEEQIISILKTALASLGYTVTGHTDAIVALDAFLSRPEEFDIIITDQMMPKLTGTEITQRIQEVRPGLPVILCSGFSETITGERAAEIGIRKFLMKPIVISELSQAIREVLEDELQER